MLRITVELLPGGREHNRRTLAVGNISRVRSGTSADYEVSLTEELLGTLHEGILKG